MRKILLSLGTFALATFSAFAQYTVDVTSDPENGYYSGGQDFSADEVASALGTDTTQLRELISAGGAVYIKTADGKSNAYTGNTNEFWMGVDGAPLGYGDAAWYSGVYYEPEYVNEDGETVSAHVTVSMGQMPNYFSSIYENSTLTCTFYVVNGEKEVSFDITLHVNAAEKAPEMAEPVGLYSQLEIVKEYDLTLDFVVGKQYEGKTYTTELAGIYDALGIDAATLDPNAASVTRARSAFAVAADGETTYSMNDTLYAPIAKTDGWFGRYINYDEATGNTTPLNGAQSFLMTYSGDCTFYLQAYALDSASFSCVYGQYPGTMKAGDTDFAELYIVNGTKAAKLVFTANIIVPEITDLGEMILAGEDTISISAEIDNNYATKGFSVDMEAVLAALGCEASDILDVYAWGAEGAISDNHTEGSGGYYFNEEGYIASWGSSSAFFIALGSLADGSYTIGQMSGHYTDIKEDVTCSADLIFQNGNKYYLTHVYYTVKAPVSKDEDFKYTLKSVEGINLQVVPNTVVYNGTEQSTIDLDYIESLIGTKDFKLYSDGATTDEETNETTLSWTSNYTCTPAPGFWFGSTSYENEDGQNVVVVQNWGSTCGFGLTYADGVITWYEIPDTRTAGETYYANLYLANEETGDYVKYVLNVNYVDEVVPDAETVATQDVLVYVDEKSLDNSYGKLDIEALCEALGAANADELNQAKVVIAKSATVFDYIELDDLSIYFNAAGYAVPETSEWLSMVCIGFDDDGNLTVIADIANENVETAKAIIGLELNAKRVMFNVTFTNDYNKVLGVEIATATIAPKAIYTVSGVKASSMQKGINIIKMTDGSVKKVIK